MKKKTFKYTVELSEEMWPRHIADCMSMGSLAYRLLSVTDTQRDDHWYGHNGRTQSATFQVRRDNDEDEQMTHAAMLNHYYALWEKATGTVEKAAYDWIIKLLSCSWVPGNMGMLSSYTREFIRILDAFEAHCERNGKFAEAEEVGLRQQDEPGYGENTTTTWN